MNRTKQKPIIGITIGDPAGIGPEIVVKALQEKCVREAALPVLFVDIAVLQQALELTDLSLSYQIVPDSKSFAPAADTIYVVPAEVIQGTVSFGQVDGLCGQAAYRYLSTAIEWAQAERITALATAPINKRSLQAAKVPFIDHTAILAHMTGVANPMTLFMVGGLRIFFLTRHISLRKVADSLDVELVLQGLRRCDMAMRQLGFSRPRLALAALNPHGGEDGLFGDEENRILAPAIAAAKKEGIEVSGPIPADSVFHLCLQGRFDAVLSLYHDQGHIAAKTYDFHRTISLTMGLPFLRTSVDHGTAFDIAGRNIATATGMVEAILAAAKYGQNVRKYYQNA